MATIAELAVEIKTKAEGLSRGLAGAASRVGRFVAKVGKMLAGISAIVAAAVTAAAYKINNLISETAQKFDKLAKTAEKLGIGIEALQKLQFQANLTGVSTETLNMALQRMVRRIAEAAKGTGEAKDALKELGLDAEYINRLSPEKQFQEIARAMGMIRNQADKVRLAMRLFDSEGVALVNTLNSNLQKSGDEFERLGATINRDQAARLELLNDTKLKLSTIWEGFKAQVAANVAGPMTRIINQVIEFIKEMGGIEVVAKRTASFLMSVVSTISSGIMSFVKLASEIQDTLGYVFGYLNYQLIRMEPTILMVHDALSSAFKGARTIVSDLIEQVVKLIDVLTTAFEKINSFRQSATTSALDLLPSLQYNPNAQAPSNDAMVQAARANRSRIAGLGPTEHKIVIVPDQEAFFQFVTENQKFKDTVVISSQKAVEDSARMTRR